MIRLCIQGSREDAQQELSKRNLAELSEFVVESVDGNYRTIWDYNGQGIAMHTLASWFLEVTSRECNSMTGFPNGTLIYYRTRH